MLDLALGIASANTTNPPGGLVGSAQNPGALWPNYASLWYLVLKGNPASTVNNILPARVKHFSGRGPTERWASGRFLT
jgi:hypothetical protein